MCLVLWLVENRFLAYRGVQDGLEASQVRVGRGIGCTSMIVLGVRRGLIKPQRSLLFSIGPESRWPQPLALTNGSEVLRRRGQPLCQDVEDGVEDLAQGMSTHRAR